MGNNNSPSWAKSISAAEKNYWQRLANEYDVHIAQISSKHLSAARTRAKKCLRCGLCCYQFPCIPRPKEIVPVANYLGLTLNELIKKYMVINTADCRTYFLRWAKHGQEDITGHLMPPLRTYDRGYCIFYNKTEKTCLIHPVRPKEARAVNCWQSKSGYDQTLWGIKGWTDADIYCFIPSFDPRRKGCQL